MGIFIRPVNSSWRIVGRISYSDSVRAWNTIRFKKRILEELKDLKDPRGRFRYELYLFYDHVQLDEVLQKMRKNGEGPPMLFRIVKEEETEV